ncbi:MAG: sodium/proline symporter PutP [Ruminococcus sp.]|nr:sodium/proline symporter PutP [Ruminococcus sp.]
MTREQILMLISIIVYLLMILYIGIRFSKKNNTVDDFYLGGRRLGPLVTAMSAEASDMSSWLLMGLPGLAYLSGICDAGWTAIGLAIGTYVNWLFVAKRLRYYSQRCGNAITIPDFFSNRYRDNKKILLGISALIIVIFFIPYTGSGFAACGKLFSSLFDIDYHLAMIISALIIIAYTCLGGFLAASTTDLIQSIIMTIALIIVLGFGINVAGGLDAVIENAKSLPGYLSMNSLYDPTTGKETSYGMLKIASMMAWGLGYFGMPHILLRFMAIEDRKKIKTSRRIASIWVVISLAIAVFIGVIGLAMTNAGAIGTLKDSQAETIIVKISSLLSTYGVIPALIAGVILAGIMASTMSTSDSQLLAASSSVSQNILPKVFKINITEKASMIVARITLVIIAIIGVIIAWDPNSSVFGIVSFAWAGFGATFGPVMLFALFWKRSNKYGAIAGMIVGGVMVFVWKYVIATFGGIWSIYELLPAFICASIAIIIVSLATKAPEKEITDEFEEVAAMK